MSNLKSDIVSWAGSILWTEICPSMYLSGKWLRRRKAASIVMDQVEIIY